MKKGSVTIYMSLILVILLSLFLTVIEGAKYRAVSLKAELAFDLSVYSVFAEYNRELFTQYGLFFIDTSYGETTPSLERVNGHFKYYMEHNLDKKEPEFLVFDITGCRIGDTKVGAATYATEQSGKAFKRQAIEYMKNKYGLSYIEKIRSELTKAQEENLFTRSFSSQREESEEKIRKAKDEGIETGEVTEEGEPVKKKVELDNPADNVNLLRSKGILALVTGPEEIISQNVADISECASQNKRNGKKNEQDTREKASLAEEFLFDAYILEKCGTYISPKKEGVLQYQAEYVLVGNTCDIENLKSVVNRLLLLREVSNCIYLFSDAAKVSEAEVMATAICLLVGAEPLIEPLKLTLIFAWAYAEAIYDVKSLLKEEKVPLLKSSATWHSSLTGALSDGIGAVADDVGSDVSQGLSYEEYLRLFLALQNKESKIYRMMNIAELDVRKQSGHWGFSLNYCVDFLILEAVVVSRYGYDREMERKYSYI